ncbi:tandem-95 repeat protein, partial [bacterium]|nr:tandem-95 repeat protein [bacterium]
SLRYRLKDNLDAISNTALVAITVTNVNDLPVAFPDTAATDEETEVIIDVLANDRDIDSNFDLSSVSVLLSPNQGGVSVNSATGQINYLPGLNFVGSDSLTYQVSDTEGAVSNAAKIYISVGNVNDPPVTVADSTQTDEETPVTVAVLSNDQDVDGSIDASSLGIADQPGHGTASVDGGSIIYTPEPNFVGVDSLTYTVADDDGASSVPTKVTAIVTDVNDPPVASDDSVATDEETLVEIQVLANDSDIDGTVEPRTLTIVTPPANGTAEVDAGNVRYTPAQDFVGIDTFTYRVSDEDDAISNMAAVTVAVANLNDRPVAVDDTARTNKDTPFSVQVLANDYDVDGSVVVSSLTLISAPRNGVVSVDGSIGEIGYTPPTGFIGADTLTYTVADELGAVSNVGMAIIIVNEFPVANDDNVLTVEEQPVEVDVLANDFDTDASLDPASLVVADQASQGVAVPNPSAGTITYTPNPNYFGPDSFTYTVRDEFGAISNVATVGVQVNRPPVAVNDDATTHEDIDVEIAAAVNDIDLDGAIDASTLQIVNPPNNGTAEVDTVRGIIIYTPTLDYSGDDAFSYRVKDNQGALSNIATIAISVNDAPIATKDSILTHLDTPVSIDIKANDSDSDGAIDSASVQVLTPPAFGTATLDFASGIITYSSNPGYFGMDRLAYSIADLQGARSDSGSVTIRVNNPPITEIDSVQTIRMIPVLVDVLKNDSDVDGTIDSTSVIVLAGPENGTASVDGTSGAITYSPDEAFSGNDSLAYGVTDNDGGISASTRVRIFVAPNATPVALNDSASTDEDSAVVIGVLVNDSDADFDGYLDSTSVSVLNPPRNGTTSINSANGEITYTPNSDFFGTDSLTYTVKDNVGAESDAAKVTVIVRSINDPPVAVSDTARTNEVTTATIPVTVNDVDIDGTLNLTSVTLQSLPNNGIASVQPETGAVIYTPAGGFSGKDTLTYSVNDNDSATSNIASVLIIVNDSPIARDDSARTDEEQMVRINVLPNDTDSDGTLDSSSVTLVSPPSNGSVALDTLNGELIYTPVSNFFGLDSLDYQVRDEQSASSNTAKVFIRVENINDPPVAEDDQANTNEEVALVLDVLQNDRDIDGDLDSKTVTVVEDPRNGNATVNDTTGSITYTPALNFFGVDSLSYNVKDENGATSNTATVRLLVANVNDPPVALSDSVRTDRGKGVEIAPLVNDRDIDGFIDATSVVVSPGRNGTA